MKTIEEAKDDCINYGCLKYRESYCTAVYANGIDYGFEAGVAFAQRWISVEDELPFGFVTLKCDSVFMQNAYVSVDFSGVNEVDTKWIATEYYKATHWRPIELK